MIIKDVSPEHRAELEQVRKIIKQLAPDAEEVISYAIPAFKYKKHNLIYFAAFKNHMSLFPASDQMIEEIGEELAKFRKGKGTLRFTVAKPIPVTILKQLIKYRIKQIDSGHR